MAATTLDPTQPMQPADLDQLFGALADPTRRAVLERLGRGPAATSELARPFEMALPSFTQHLQMLERCGLVTSNKAGRVRTYRLSPQPLDAAHGWLDRQRDLWERRLDQLDDHLRATHATEQTPIEQSTRRQDR